MVLVVEVCECVDVVLVFIEWWEFIDFEFVDLVNWVWVWVIVDGCNCFDVICWWWVGWWVFWLGVL